MRIEEELKLDYSDVLFRPKRSTLQSRKDVNLKRTYKFKYSNNEWSGIPIMASNMDGVGELSVAEKLSEYGMITCLTKQHNIQKIKKFKKIKSIHPNIALSIGIKKEDFENLDKILKEYSFIKFICIDVANGYSEHFSKFLKSVRDKYPTKTIIADGGCTCPGDVAKGFGGGADFVMLGGMFAGHDEGEGKLIKSNGHKFIEFYGSSSDIANKKHYGGLSDYRSSEGRTVRIKYRGKIKDTINNILGGVRSSCSYVGAPSLKQLSKCTTFVRVAKQFNDTFTK